MFKLLMLLCACASAHGRKMVGQSDCADTYDEVEKILEASNANMKHLNVLPKVEGFQSDLSLSLFMMPLEVGNGSMTGLSSLSQPDYANVECWTDNSRTMFGNFVYDKLTLTYSNMKTSFLWFFGTSGKLTVTWVQPRVYMNMTKTTSDCHINEFTFSEPTEIEYDVTPEGSPLTGSLVSALLRSFLAHDGNSTPLLSYIKKTTQSVVESHFKSSWCANTYPGPWFHTH